MWLQAVARLGLGGLRMTWFPCPSPWCWFLAGPFHMVFPTQQSSSNFLTPCGCALKGKSESLKSLEAWTLELTQHLFHHILLVKARDKSSLNLKSGQIDSPLDNRKCKILWPCFFLILTQVCLLFERGMVGERGEGDGEREKVSMWERNIDHLPLLHTLTDQGSNLQPYKGWHFNQLNHLARARVHVF